MVEKNITGQELMAKAKFFSGYSRWITSEGRYETWEEAVQRVMDMHKTKYADRLSDELQAYIEEAQDAYNKKEVLGSQRAFQFGGEQLLRHEARNYNCSSSYVDRPAFFQEAMYLLLCGAGVGFSVQKQHVEQLPKLVKRSDTAAKVFIIPDSIEGWADAFGVLLSSFFEDGGTFPEYRGCKVLFDFSKIRPEGAPISGGFKAPGPDGLRQSLQKCEELLTREVEEQYKTSMRPIVAYDFIMHMADAVLSGGVRRSATICLFSKDDQEMLNAKTGNWFEKNPQRGRSNNSAILKRDELSPEEWQQIIASVKDFGEPGFIFTDDTEALYNPCVPGDTLLLTQEGYIPVKDTVGKETTIWNGFEWSTVKPFSTGVNPLVEVTFSDGTTLKCTPYHKFFVSTSYHGKPVKVEAKDLKEGDKLVKFAMPVINAGDTATYEIDAYSQGFYAGDGNDGYSYSRIYPTKYEVVDRLVGTIGGEGTENLAWYHGKMYDKFFIPFHGSKEYKINWLAGLFDADGCVASSTLQLVSTNLKFLQDLRLMLTTLGVQAKVIRERPEKMTQFHKDQRAYLTKETHRILITSFDVCRLRDLGMRCERLNIEDINTQRDARQFVKVVSVTDLGFSEETFCVTEPKNNSVTFNGIVTGNCVEIGMYAKDVSILETLIEEYGKDDPKVTSGFQMCNLVEINGGKCTTEDAFYKACRAGAILGTIQAGYTDFKYLSQASRNITERESLLGVSVTGWMNNPKVLFDKAVLSKGVEIIRQVNRDVARLLGIRPAARLTCVKPSGNASVLLQTASGIHGEHAPRYIRNVQMNVNEDIAKVLMGEIPSMVEPSKWSVTGKDVVVSFPVETNPESIYKKDLLGVKQLEYVKEVQQFWVDIGTNHELCTRPWLRHNVSNTITVDDWDEVASYIYDNREHFAGISLLAAAGDKAYVQAPFIEVLTSEQMISTYGEAGIFASGLVVDGKHAFNGDLFEACRRARTFTTKSVNSEEFLISLSKEVEDPLQRDWIRRFHKFSFNFFNGDLQKTEFCLKDSHNLHTWISLRRDMKDIDFSSKLKTQVEVDANTLGSQACSGGACEISF